MSSSSDDIISVQIPKEYLLKKQQKIKERRALVAESSDFNSVRQYEKSYRHKKEHKESAPKTSKKESSKKLKGSHKKAQLYRDNADAGHLESGIDTPNAKSSSLFACLKITTMIVVLLTVLIVGGLVLKTTFKKGLFICSLIFLKLIT